MDDAAEFVDRWMRSRGIDQFSYDDGARDDLVFDWVRQQDSEGWHGYAVSFNWDDGTEIARWIVDQPDCDKGTALYLYYAAQPGYYVRYPSLEAARAIYVDEEALALMLAICANWSRGVYRSYRFHPDWVAKEPEFADPDRRRALAASVPWDVPEDMADTGVAGEQVAGKWGEGIPLALDAAIRARYEPWQEYKQRTGTEDVLDVAQQIGETERPSDDTPGNVRAMWVNWVLSESSRRSYPEFGPNPLAKPDLAGTGIPFPAKP